MAVSRFVTIGRRPGSTGEDGKMQKDRLVTVGGDLYYVLRRKDGDESFAFTSGGDIPTSAPTERE